MDGSADGSAADGSAAAPESLVDYATDGDHTLALLLGVLGLLAALLVARRACCGSKYSKIEATKEVIRGRITAVDPKAAKLKIAPGKFAPGPEAVKDPLAVGTEIIINGLAPQFNPKDKKKEPWLSVSVSVLGGKGTQVGYLPAASVEVLEPEPEAKGYCGLCGGGGAKKKAAEASDEEAPEMEPMGLGSPVAEP